MGLVTDSVETASNLPQVFLLLLFLSSAFVPIDTLPEPLRTFAQVPARSRRSSRRSAGCCYGTEIGTQGVLAVAWCVGFSVVGYLWATRLYGRDFRRAGLGPAWRSEAWMCPSHPGADTVPGVSGRDPRCSGERSI